jgi:hypothetical protein
MSMSDYQLCKALKDAGFPQDFKPGAKYYAPNGEGLQAKIDPKEWDEEELKHWGVKDISEFVRWPTSYELKTACQEKLETEFLRGISITWLERHEEDLYGYQREWYDHMARLWIALNSESLLDLPIKTERP